MAFSAPHRVLAVALLLSALALHRYPVAEAQAQEAAPQDPFANLGGLLGNLTTGLINVTNATGGAAGVPAGGVIPGGATGVPAGGVPAGAAGGGNVPVVKSQPGICPFTGKPPSRPDGKLLRCTSDQNLACCSQCDDARNALGLLARNGTSVLGFLNSLPLLGPILDSMLPTVGKESFCALFGKNLKCLNMIESLVCAMTCDPTAYTFVAVGGGAGTVRLCGEFSHQLMIECGGLQIPVLGQTFKNFAPTPQDLVNVLVAPILQNAVPSTAIQTLVAPKDQGATACFNGPANGAYPTRNLCCDDLSGMPRECLAGSYLSTSQFVNRTLPPSCPGPNATIPVISIGQGILSNLTDQVKNITGSVGLPTFGIGSPYPPPPSSKAALPQSLLTLSLSIFLALAVIVTLTSEHVARQ